VASPADDLLREAVKLRDDYEEKVNDILTEAQKDILTEYKAKKAEALLNGDKSNPAKTPKK
jgi:hypothetical protein